MEKPSPLTRKVKIHIRPVKLGDLTQVIAINLASLAENYPRGLWEAKLPVCKPHSFVAIAFNQIIGYVFSCGDMIISIAVSEKYRGCGIGRQLMVNCLSTHVGTKETLRLHVRTTNVNAIALYESLGFVKDNLIAGYYVNPDCDAHEMKYTQGGVTHVRKDHFTINM